VEGEQRLVVAYYTQGIKIVDYYVDANGAVQFVERASYTLPNANTWAAEDFKVVDNADGTRTYYLAADDIHRGIDVLSWTGPPNPVGTAPPADTTALTGSALLGSSVALVGGAFLVSRRRRGSMG
jgi:hypothetical protein